MTEPGHDLHRTAKALVDAGLAASFAEADVVRDVAIHVALTEGPSHAEEAAALTAIACATRAFAGPVSFSGPAIPSRTAAFTDHTIQSAAVALGATVTASDTDADLVIAIGTSQHNEADLTVVIDGWTYAISTDPSVGKGSAAPAPWFVGIAAGAHALSEAALAELFAHPVAARRRLHRTMWPTQGVPAGIEPDPDHVIIPSALWIVGLGHLGQGVGWGLALAPPQLMQSLHLVLQDTDTVTAANISTGLLVSSEDVGTAKARTVASKLEAAGAATLIVERRLDAATVHQPDDPNVVVTCLDNIATRRLITELAAPLHLDLAIGARPHNLTSIIMRVFPDSGDSHAIPAWAHRPAAEAPPPAPAYAALAPDQCGQQLVAGRAVGAAFVGAYAGASALAELARRCMGGPTFVRTDIDLRVAEPRTDEATPLGGPPRIHTLKVETSATT